jgi:hypothetical protein
MGGSSFPNLSTPRLPPELYFQLREKYRSILKKYYDKIEVPIEAPEKTSYGDIDFIVSIEDPALAEVTMQDMCTTLNAVEITGTGSTKSLAIPCDELGEECYVQVDINKVAMELFHWQVFKHAHGDMWTLLGQCVRRPGFIADERGFHVCIEEIEPHNKKASRLMLTRDPNAVLEFLGLEVEKFWKPFGRREEMFEYVSGNRFFWRDRYVEEAFKHNDRSRMAKRPIYREFVEEWLPSHPEVEGTDRKTKEYYLEEVLERFGKRDEYNEKLDAWRKEQEEKKEKKRRILEARVAAEVGCYA